MDHHSSGFVASPWAAVLGHHAMASAGADAGFAAAAAAAHVQNVAVAAQHHHSHHQIAAAAHHTHHAHPHHSHPHTAHHHHHHHPHSHHLNPAGMPMDLHVPQGFPYYRNKLMSSLKINYWHSLCVCEINFTQNGDFFLLLFAMIARQSINPTANQPITFTATAVQQSLSLEFLWLAFKTIRFVFCNDYLACVNVEFDAVLCAFSSSRVITHISSKWQLLVQLAFLS
uniref:Uncharacterized protein n=1 Tax=Glossina palpalis gambiensis TaxID=67801 RepID=A0A1B0AU78_9MUSC